MIKKAFAAAVAVIILFSSALSFSAEVSPENIADGIIAWKKSDVNAKSDEHLINNEYLSLAGTTPGDWYVIGLSRLGKEDNYEGYLAVIAEKIKERYTEPGSLSAAKSTEWHRISLAVLAAGGDPENIGGENLIADGTYDRGKTASLGRQGINGWIWGLITLDSMAYEIPDGAFYSREDIITEIISKELSGGGFTLTGEVADPDITAMAIQSLAPYYNDEKTYEINGKSVSVREVIDRALEKLSELQTDDGDFLSWGTKNVESTDQVVVALCSLGIDPLSDSRFIKNGKTLLDGILLYRMPDGGFIHSKTYDKDNPSSLPDSSNSMAGEQTLYTMAALLRREKGMRALYDFRPEQSSALKARISDLQTEIAKIGAKTDDETLKNLLSDYYSITETERRYVYNYYLLSSAARERNIDIEKIASETKIIESPPDRDGTESKVVFSETDMAAFESLPKNPTTENYVLVITLLDKINRCEDFSGRDEIIKKLEEAKTKIAEIQAEIDSLNAEVKEKLYPLEKMTLSDLKTAEEIYRRYEKLSDYDKTKILNFEDVIKTKTHLENILRGMIIGAALTVIAAITAFFVIKDIKKRKHKKEREMEELAELYKDED